MELPSILDEVIPLVLQAGAMARAEFLRPDGPRGSGQKAPVDEEIEAFLRDAFRAVLPDARFVGEELPPVLDGDPSLVWLVDPHDGTSEFLRGARGSSVSVALLHDRVPVLGVVYAPLSPDRGPDLIGWAEGMDQIVRNGAPVRPNVFAGGLGPSELVLLAFRSYARPATNARRVAPARFMASNSVAYRLARVAAGDAVATVSRQSQLAAYDYAAGHALLRGAGCTFVDGAGMPAVYGPDGTGGMDKCFAGAPAAVAELLRRDWSLGQPPEPPIPERVTLHWPRHEDGLDRAVGCLAGLALGEGGADLLGPIAEAAILLARACIRGAPGNANRPPAARAPMAIAGRAGTEPYLNAIALGVGGGTRQEMARYAEGAVLDPELREGFALLACGAGIADVAGRSATAGALIGAVEGRAGLPEPAFRRLLSLRPDGRPPECWPDDLPLLAEALLVTRAARRSR